MNFNDLDHLKKLHNLLCINNRKIYPTLTSICSLTSKYKATVCEFTNITPNGTNLVTFYYPVYSTVNEILMLPDIFMK